jgi:hypothetical protein
MKGIIYRIICNETNDIYYGSTTRSIKQRMNTHRNSKKEEEPCSSLQIIERNNYYYEIVEELEFEDKMDLLNREKWYILNNKCINKCLPFLTDEERKHYYKDWCEKNKEQLKNYHKEWYEVNKDKMKEKKKEYSKIYNEANKAKRKEWYEANKEEINQRRRELSKQKREEKNKIK